MTSTRFGAALGLSIYFYGRQIIAAGASVTNPSYIAITYDNANTDPYYLVGLETYGIGSVGVAFDYNQGAAQPLDYGVGGPAVGDTLNYLGSTRFGGSATGYRNGVVGTTLASPAGAVITTATATTIIGGSVGQADFSGAAMSIGGIWNRALSADEALLLYNNPFAMLRQLLAPRRRASIAVTTRRPTMFVTS